jgi:hypothetical protein
LVRTKINNFRLWRQTTPKHRLGEHWAVPSRGTPQEESRDPSGTSNTNESPCVFESIFDNCGASAVNGQLSQWADVRMRMVGQFPGGNFKQEVAGGIT